MTLAAVESALCGARALVLVVWVARDLKFDTDLERQLPGNHPYARTALDYKDRIAGLDSVQIVVETAACRKATVSRTDPATKIEGNGRVTAPSAPYPRFG